MNSHYRIVIRFDTKKELFTGSVPELPGCRAEGESWDEVTKLLNESIDKKLETIEHPPTPLDEVDWDGKLQLELSKSMYRELAFMAKHDEVSIETLASELLSEGLGRRYGGHRYYRSSSRKPSGGRGRNNRNMSADKYHNIMEDKASFLEYVRGLDEPGKGNRR